MIIRKMTVSDLVQIIDIEKTCFTADAWSEEDFAWRFDDEGFVNLVCEHDGDVIGYITAGVVLDEMSIDSVAVNPVHRRQGIAKSLIMQAIAIKKPSVVYLEVRESNSGAISLYESLGFEKVGLRKGYYQRPVENAILYTLSI